jgi:hypothetical protein
MAAHHQQQQPPHGYYNYYNYGGQMSQQPNMYNPASGTPPAHAMPSYPGFYGAAASNAPPPPPFPSRKRPRESGEEAPVSSSYRCAPCNLNLDSASALAAHEKSHITCTACPFVGAPKVVKGHFQAVHGKFSGSGYKTVTVAVPGCRAQRFRICVGNRPEDVQRWIAERRKRFPRKQPLPPPPKPAKPEGLSTLLDGYSSSEEEKEKSEKLQKEEDSAPPAASADAKDGVTPNELPQPKKKPCHSFMRHGQCRRGDACPYSHDANLRQQQQQPHHQRNTSLKRRAANNRPTLLSDLLKADADRETKLSLQLIHYIVHSDFLKKRI